MIPVQGDQVILSEMLGEEAIRLEQAATDLHRVHIRLGWTGAASDGYQQSILRLVSDTMRVAQKLRQSS